MNPDTGAIALFETLKDAKQAGYTVPLTAEQAAELAQLPREQRKASYKALSRTKQLPEARAKKRSKRKAQRKARRLNRGR